MMPSRLTSSILAAYRGLAFGRGRPVTLGVPYPTVFDPPGAEPRPPGIPVRSRFTTSIDRDELFDFSSVLQAPAPRLLQLPRTVTVSSWSAGADGRWRLSSITLPVGNSVWEFTAAP